MGFFNFNKKQPVVEEPQPEPQYGRQAFSTPFMTTGKGNLSAPVINAYYNNNGYVMFGSDNLYPQLLVQLYYQSAIHGAAIDFKTDSVIGGGYKWSDKNQTMRQQVEMLAFEKRTKFEKLVKSLTKDIIIHGRVTVKVCKSESGLVSIKRIDPSYIRHSSNLELFTYSNDWSRGLVQAKTYKPYSKDLPESLYVYQIDSPGQDVYALPTYNSILNYADFNGEICYYHKNNIKNSVFPSLVISRPTKFKSKDEENAFKRDISDKKGPRDAGDVLILTGNGFDDIPKFESVPVSNNDKLFETALEQLREEICIAHKVNPSIMGIKVAGSLGNSQEVQFLYSSYEKNVVMPLRAIMTEIFNDLVDICGIKGTIEIANYQLIDNVITETKPTK